MAYSSSPGNEGNQKACGHRALPLLRLRGTQDVNIYLLLHLTIYILGQGRSQGQPIYVYHLCIISMQPFPVPNIPWKSLMLIHSKGIWTFSRLFHPSIILECAYMNSPLHLDTFPLTFNFFYYLFLSKLLTECTLLITE